MFVNRGELLFISNNEQLLTAVLDRAVTAAPATTPALTYAAGFRLARERANYERMMTALDFGNGGNPSAPLFFSGNVLSLGRVLGTLAEVHVTERQRDGVMSQKVIYQLGR